MRFVRCLCQPRLSRNIVRLLIQPVLPILSVVLVRSKDVLSVTTVIPSVVIDSQVWHRLNKAEYFWAIFNLDPSHQRQETRRSYTLCINASFWRMQPRVAFLSQQLQWHVKNREDTWLAMQMWPDTPSLIWIRRIKNALGEWFRWPRTESSWIQIWPVFVGSSDRQLSPRDKATLWGHNFSTAVRRNN